MSCSPRSHLVYMGLPNSSPAPVLSSHPEFINSDLFIRTFGFPVQVFRAGCATMAAVFITRSLRAFQVESNQRIKELHDAQVAEQERLDALKAELLHRTVIAQESERQRIARELHDETGQTLTALGMGLRGMSEMISTNRNRAIEQANQLEKLAMDGVEELQRMVSGLHPPQLDDLGLACCPALVCQRYQHSLRDNGKYSQSWSQASVVLRCQVGRIQDCPGSHHECCSACQCQCHRSSARLFSG